MNTGDIILHPARQRAIQKAIEQWLVDNGYEVSTPISPSFLRQELALVSGQGTYDLRFGEKDNRIVNGRNAPDENLLLRNDTFVVIGNEFDIKVETIANPGTAVPQTFISRNTFNTTTNPTPAQLEAIYQGKLSFFVDEKLIFGPQYMRNFRVVPFVQDGDTLIVNREATGADTVTLIAQSARQPLENAQAIERLIYMHGDNQNRWTLQFSTQTDIQYLTTSQVVIGLTLHGFRLPGVNKSKGRGN